MENGHFADGSWPMTDGPKRWKVEFAP